MYRLLAVLSLALFLGPVANAEEAVTGRVTLAPELAERADPGHTVFIFARAVQGPRMPLAILRAHVSDLPLDFRLDDSQAMTPAARLSGFDEVYVIARISSYGDAQARSGDMEGTSEAISPGTHDVDVVIDKVVP